eukprot:3625114-Pyramimonas_sp.AAC.1
MLHVPPPEQRMSCQPPESRYTLAPLPCRKRDGSIPSGAHTGLPCRGEERLPAGEGGKALHSRAGDIAPPQAGTPPEKCPGGGLLHRRRATAPGLTRKGNAQPGRLTTLR